jgi:hypothetical protein
MDTSAHSAIAVPTKNKRVARNTAMPNDTTMR